MAPPAAVTAHGQPNRKAHIMRERIIAAVVGFAAAASE
jgi:hypothetical protein